MSDNTTLDPITEAEAPKGNEPHRILVTFPSDHEISGMKVEIIGVTPEQIAVANFHIGRAADQVADARMIQAEAQRREIEAVQRSLATGGMPSGILDKLRRT